MAEHQAPHGFGTAVSWTTLSFLEIDVPTLTGKLMPTSYQGASGPSGPIAGSQPTPRQPVSENHVVHGPALLTRWDSYRNKN